MHLHYPPQRQHVEKTIKVLNRSLRDYMFQRSAVLHILHTQIILVFGCFSFSILHNPLLNCADSPDVPTLPVCLHLRPYWHVTEESAFAAFVEPIPRTTGLKERHVLDRIVKSTPRLLTACTITDLVRY